MIFLRDKNPRPRDIPDKAAAPVQPILRLRPDAPKALPHWLTPLAQKPKSGLLSWSSRRATKSQKLGELENTP